MKDAISSVMRIFEKIDEIRSRPDFTVVLEECSHKDYYSIIIKATSANEEYSNVVIMYTNDEFNDDEIIEEMDTIVQKARGLFER